MNPANKDNPPSGQPKQTKPAPPDLDLDKYPHYSVQSSIYSLLLTALNLSERYEKYPGAEERQEILDDMVRVYQNTCDLLRIKP